MKRLLLSLLMAWPALFIQAQIFDHAYQFNTSFTATLNPHDNLIYHEMLTMIGDETYVMDNQIANVPFVGTYIDGAVVTKFSGGGFPIWSKRVQIPGFTTHFTNININHADDAIYLVGTLMDSYYKTVVVKLDPNTGAVLAQKTYEATNGGYMLHAKIKPFRGGTGMIIVGQLNNFNGVQGSEIFLLHIEDDLTLLSNVRFVPALAPNPSSSSDLTYYPDFFTENGEVTLLGKKGGQFLIYHYDPILMMITDLYNVTPGDNVLGYAPNNYFEHPPFMDYDDNTGSIYVSAYVLSPNMPTTESTMVTKLDNNFNVFWAREYNQLSSLGTQPMEVTGRMAFDTTNLQLGIPEGLLSLDPTTGLANHTQHYAWYSGRMGNHATLHPFKGRTMIHGHHQPFTFGFRLFDIDVAGNTAGACPNAQEPVFTDNLTMSDFLHLYRWLPFAHADTIAATATTIHGEVYDCNSNYLGFFKTTTGSNELVEQNKSIRVFPNPNNGTFTVESTSGLAGQFQLLSPDGKVVLTEDISENEPFTREYQFLDLPQGVYFLQVSSGGGQESHRLIIH